jgi:DNA-binding NtrC family response regulator
MRFRILFISGCLDDARHLSQMLHSLPLKFDHAESLHQARNMLTQDNPHVVLTAADLPDGNWLDVLDAAGRVPVIVTDPHADGRLWAAVLNRGGYDLLAQPFYAPEVRRILGNAATRPYAASAL